MAIAQSAQTMSAPTENLVFIGIQADEDGLRA